MDDVLLDAGIEKAKGIVTVVTNDAENVFITRSEEHTSELQSHSFISYAVFCLKKKRKKKEKGCRIHRIY